MSSLIILLTALIAASVGPLAARAAEPAAAAPGVEAATFAYVGYMGGIKVGWANADIAVAPDRYGAALKMETGGMVGWFIEWRHGSNANGAVQPGGIAPLAPAFYRNDAYWKERDRFVEVAFPAGVAGIAAADPHPVTDEGRPAVPAFMLQDVLDPLSAIVAIGRTIETTGRCDASFGVFDGRRLYQLKVTDDGDTMLSSSSRAPFGGEARRCRFVFERKAGFKNIQSDDPTAGRAYFRRTAPGAPIMPVQVVADTSYGAALLNLQSATLLDAAATQRALAPTEGALRQ
mgnify:CR=1 FL=1